MVAVVDEKEQTLIPRPLSQCCPRPVKDRGAVEVVRPGRGGDVDGQQVRERGERDRSTLGMSARPGARHAGRVGELKDLFGEPGLADAGTTGEEHAPGSAVAEPIGEQVELAPAPDHGPRRSERRFDECPGFVGERAQVGFL